jgi:hypothetical protein
MGETMNGLGLVACPSELSFTPPFPRGAAALRLSHSAGLALLSLVTNRMLTEQVRGAHAWGEYLREQSARLAELSGTIRDPAMREPLAMLARMGSHAGEAVIDAAVEWGRQHGHLAFALPVATCSEG